MKRCKISWKIPQKMKNVTKALQSILKTYVIIDHIAKCQMKCVIATFFAQRPWL